LIDVLNKELEFDNVQQKDRLQENIRMGKKVIGQGLIHKYCKRKMRTLPKIGDKK